MSQFAIEKFTNVTIVNVNVRSELRGQDHVPAMDIAARFTTSNNVLSEFDGHLKGMLYQKASSEHEQGALPGIEPITNLPMLRTQILGPLKIKREFTGYKMVIRQGIDDTDNIVIDGCDVDKFVFDCKEGGSVEISFRVQASGVDARVLGRVGALVQQSVEVTLDAPVESGQMALSGGVVTPLHAVKKSEPDATDKFVAGGDAAQTGDF